MEDLKQQFLDKAAQYFDKRVEDNEVAVKALARDMGILTARARALYLAQHKLK